MSPPIRELVSSTEPPRRNTDWRADLTQRIKLESRNEQDRSILGDFVATIWQKTDDSARLDLNICANSAQATAEGNSKSAIALKARIDKDLELLNKHQEWTKLAVEGLKTAGLFMSGPLGIAATVTLYGLDQVHLKDNLKDQQTDLTLGGLKGGTLSALFMSCAEHNAPAAVVGVGLSIASRITDTAFKRDTWWSTGQNTADLSAGCNKVLETALDPVSLTADAACLMLTHGILSHANQLTGERLFKSSLATTALSGGIFGGVSGGVGEFSKETSQDTKLDYQRIMAAALTQGSVDMVAAGIGGSLTNRRMQAELGGLSGKLTDSFSSVHSPIFETLNKNARAVSDATKLSWLDTKEKFQLGASNKPGIFETISKWHQENLQHKQMRQAATEVVSQLQKQGHTALWVGGCVRDELMGRRPKDYDIATSASDEEVRQIFKNGEPVGKTFGVNIVDHKDFKFDVATFRTEGGYSDGRRPDWVKFAKSPQEDASRRDFTINAMYKDPVTGKIYDFYGGRQDLKNKVIRAVGDPYERISEDALRMMRAARFAAKYGFTIDPKLEEAITRNASRIRPRRFAQRAGHELKGILTSPNPLTGLDFMMKTGLMKYTMPQVARTNTIKGEQDPTWHPEGNTWMHTRKILPELQKQGGGYELMMSGLLHDIGKPHTQMRHDDGSITNIKHEHVGAKMVGAIARRQHWSKEQQSLVTNVVDDHMRMHRGHELNAKKLDKLIQDPHYQYKVKLQHADAMATDRGFADRMDKSRKLFYLTARDKATNKSLGSQRLDAPPIVTSQLLMEMGFKGGRTGGPEFGKILKAAAEQQRAGTFTDLDGAKAWVSKQRAEKSL